MSRGALVPVAVAVVAVALFIGAVVTVIVAQQSVGWPSLIAMLVALAVLIALLGWYNRRHR